MKFHNSTKSQRINWMLIIIVVLGSFYISLFYLVISKSQFPDYGADYLAWWSAGKIADQQGYSQIYNWNLLQSVQEQEFKSLGLTKGNENLHIIPSTAPIFSFFVVPFQFLSRVNSRVGYWLYTAINFFIFISYLLFFIWKVQKSQTLKYRDFLLLFLMLFSYPVFMNIGMGQVQTFLLVCIGEFIRNAKNKKPFVSGIWLAGLLLKFQLSILVIPVLLVMKEWKCLKGFLISSVVILGISIGLSGINGMLALVHLLTNKFIPAAPSNPEVMVNWRMVGVNFNSAIGSPIGWVIAGIGIALTILSVYFLIKRGYQFGSPEWMMTMLGVFSATIAVSWHSHYHLVMVLIPLVIATTISKNLSDKVMYFWVIFTPAIWFVYLVVSSLLSTSVGMDIGAYQGIVLGLSGFLGNITLLGAAIRFSNIPKRAISQ